LLAVVGWLVEHPRPGIYLRQVDLPGVHSKFIEAHRGVLAELLDWVLPVDAVKITKAGVSPFAGRYGFLDKPTHIRFRVFDPVIQAVPSSVCPDVTLDAHASVWSAENKPRRVNLHRLTPEARALYDDLRDHRICAELRLEQEHMSFRWLRNRLLGLLSGSGGINPCVL
jgi:hypothetical protein